VKQRQTHDGSVNPAAAFVCHPIAGTAAAQRLVHRITSVARNEAAACELGIKHISLPSHSSKSPQRQFDSLPVGRLRRQGGIHRWAHPSRRLFKLSEPRGARAHRCRVGEHTDYGLLTLLWQETVGGLQVRSGPGADAWIDAPPRSVGAQSDCHRMALM
jgi:hypothetical protein